MTRKADYEYIKSVKLINKGTGAHYEKGGINTDQDSSDCDTKNMLGQEMRSNQTNLENNNDPI